MPWCRRDHIIQVWGFYTKITKVSFQPSRTKKDHDESLRFTKKSLPSNFAEQLLNLEIELELNENVQVETI
jgi:hypothetical protein